MEPTILGLAASHNGAACLLRGGEIVAAIQEERLTRKKRAVLDPAEFRALEYLNPERIDLVALCPLHDRQKAEARLDAHPRLGKLPRVVVSHHRAHAMAAWAQSGFFDAVVLVIDGAGSRAEDLPEDERLGEGRETVSIYRAKDGVLTPVHKQFAVPVNVIGDFRPRMMPFTSLGVMYQSVAQQIFGHWDAAGKVMGLAPYGQPARPVSDYLELSPLRFVDRVFEDHRTAERWPARQREYQTLAAETQIALEEGVLAMARLARQHGDRLCYAGGVALNSVANTRILELFREVFIMPAAEDNGTAIGAAYLAQPGLHAIQDDALGKRYADTKDFSDEAAELLAAGKVVGWFQGRSEFGPRALGQRSILMDPRIPDGRERLNRIKRREGFRPYAPAILEEKARDWFERAGVSPFMLQVWRFRPERAHEVPAVVHVDGTGRVQTVKTGPFRRLIDAFHARTGVPMVLNTSFNIAGEPIVESPDDALEIFSRMELDALVLDDRIIHR